MIITLCTHNPDYWMAQALTFAPDSVKICLDSAIHGTLLSVITDIAIIIAALKKCSC